jgi:hypothetical protein
MRKLTLSHLVVALLALALGAAGTAVAAKLITSKQIKNGTIKLKDLSKKAQEDLAGAGAPGTNGTPGADGSAGPTLFLGSMGTATFSNPSAGGNFGTEQSAQAPIPEGSAFTAKSFTARVNPAPGAGDSVKIAFRIDGADTPLTCTISNADTSCTPPGDPTVVVPAGALISMQTTETGTPSSTIASYGFRGEF